MAYGEAMITQRKVFIPYINGHIYDLWGGEPHNVRVFASREDTERFGFSDVREIELWEEEYPLGKFNHTSLVSATARKRKERL